MTRPNRGKIVELIDELVGDLDQPFTEDDQYHGWSDKNRPVAVDTLNQIRERLEDPRPISEDEVRPSLTRDFDALGIDGGCLLNRVAVIDNLLNRLVGRR
jgi:hypothetical protein